MCEETGNHLWAIQDILGHGATSQVYKAYNKTTGALVAAKVYEFRSKVRPTHDAYRHPPGERDFRPILAHEMEILKEAKHENIVRYIAYEPVISLDASSTVNREALLLEYCNGGSLRNVLDQPENRYGLDEEDFMRLYKHLSAALKYLHDKKTVSDNDHRIVLTSILTMI
jgi:TANK-binding kinase 1